MFAWMGQVLRIDLSNSKVSKESLDVAMLRDYIGARGLGSRISPMR